MNLFPPLETPLVILGAVTAAVGSGLAVVWQWIAVLGNANAEVAPSVLYSAIVVLFGSLTAVVVWIGTKFLAQEDERNKVQVETNRAVHAQAESNRAVAEALNTFTERFDGPIMDLFSASVSNAYQQGIEHNVNTFAAPLLKPRKK